jgi:predicted ester cyclase
MNAIQEQNKALSRRALAEIDAGNIDFMDDVTAPGATFAFPGSPGLDLAGFKHFCRMFRSAFPDFVHEIKDMVAEGEKVVRIGVFLGTHKAEFLGVPATGKRVRMDFIGVDTFRDGKLVALHGSPDMLGLMQQIGAIPAMA